MKISKNILFIIIALIIGFLYVSNKFPQFCNDSRKKSDTTILRDTAWKVKIEKSTVYTPGPVKILPGDTKWMYLPIDTLAILRDYNLKRIYNDTILIDSFGYVSWEDTVTKNKIERRQKFVNYKIPVITNTVTINNYYKQKRQLNTSVLLDLPRFTIYGGLLYEDRKDKIYQLNVGYGLNGPTFNVGMSFPLWTESSSILIK
jgi:hypothetical protein